jgi:hypothetical protein
MTFTGRLGVMFSRLPFGWHKWPQAAQRVITVLGERVRHCRLAPDGLYEAFVLSDPKIMKLLKDLGDEVGRRCVQKGLKQLEDLGVIRRIRQGGVRFIRFLVSFAKPDKPTSHSGRKVGSVPKPTARPTSAPAPGPAAEKPPAPDPGPTLSPQETAAAIRAATAEATSGPTQAAPGRRFGPSPRAAVPRLSDPERARQAEERRRRNEAWIAARKQARAVDRGDQPPGHPEDRGGSDEIARE